ncbi:MAG: phosphate-selective porin OprO/OprP [Sphingobacteriales bacterium]|jgi:phosphate-selective porin OprO/OprP
MIKYFILLSISVLIVFTLNAQEENNIDWYAATKLKTADGDADIKFGGRIQVQSVIFNQDSATQAAGNAISGSQLRRLRFYSSGKVYNKSLDYKLQLEFVGAAVGVRDAFITLRNLPVVGNFRVGQMKEAIGYDKIMSSNDIAFIERTALNNLHPQRNVGASLFNTSKDENFRWEVGVFQDATTQGFTNPNNTFNTTGRLTKVLLYENSEDLYRLLHIGVAGSIHNPSGGLYKTTARPETGFGPRYINTGEITGVENQTIIAGEFALFVNNLNVLAEYTVNSLDVNTSLNGNLNFSAFFVEAGWFLTNEHMGYVKSKGITEGMNPNKNFSTSEPGSGAIQFVARYSSADFNDVPITGGQMDILSFGVNWWLNPATRFSINENLVDLENVGNTNITQLKFQLLF